MWPGQQPPGGEQNPQNNPYQQPGYQQPGYQQPNPYQQQPGYPQANPYAQPQQQWGPPGPAGGPQPPQGGDGGNRTKIVAIVAAAAVVVAAAVTGAVVLGGGKDDKAGGGSTTKASPSASVSAGTSASGSDDNPRGNETEKPTVPGWKVVVNPKYGTAFDVPPDWQVDSPGVFTFFEDQKKGDGSPYIGFSAPAFLKSNYCSSDDDKDGHAETSSLAASGTKGEDGGKDTASIARMDAALFAYGGYTNQTKAEKKYLTVGSAKPFTTTSGVKGSVATSYTNGVPKVHKCDTDGKATTFAFKNSQGDFVSWTLYGAKGVKEEIPDATVRKILGSVRLHGDPTH
ncbi:hypothetical protein [Streptomyces tropicalis]|uniref:DUF8017 domain-containing protein n=1 Tax=Streptomyces tropicalis TaxID=3034234 RepID=A0ABT6A4N7_9ACTN|nr:hypothetical protein [Streptomyces tropicalis]MDF3299611.1 hypothetical protein [Streptomyces tropicalis]